MAQHKDSVRTPLQCQNHPQNQAESDLRILFYSQQQGAAVPNLCNCRNELRGTPQNATIGLPYCDDIWVAMTSGQKLQLRPPSLRHVLISP